MKLNELLDAAVPHKVTAKEADEYVEEARINGRKIIFVCAKDNLIARNELWEVAFLEQLEGKAPGDYDMTIHKTGSGGAPKVFAFVKAALERFLDHYHPIQFEFSAAHNEPSRVKLYDAFIKRFAAGSEYKVTTRDQHGERYWRFVHHAHAST